MEVKAFRKFIPYIMIEMFKSFGGIFCLHPQARRLDFIISPSRTSTSNRLKSRGDQMKSDFQTHCKGKGYPCHVYASTEGRRLYSFNPFANSAPEWGGGLWSAKTPDRFTPEKEPVPTLQEAGWDSGSDQTGMENSPPPEFDLRTAQTAASHYTNHIIQGASRHKDRE